MLIKNTIIIRSDWKEILFKKIKKIISRNIDLILAVFGYLILAIIFTWPVILNIKTMIYGHPGDPFYNLWVFHNLRFHDLMVNIPFGLADPNHIIQPTQPVIDFISKILTYLFNDTAAYNLMIILSFVLSGLVIYLLVKLLTKNSWASFIAGLIFAFSPYHLAHAGQHINLTSTYWIVFFVYFLIKYWQKPIYINAVCAGLFFAITLMDNYQYGFFATIIFILFLVISTIYQWITDKKLNLHNLKLIIVFGLVVFLIISIFDTKVINALFSNKGLSSLGSTRSFEELKVYSAEKFNYILPPPENPFFGKYSAPIFDKSIKKSGSNITEQTLYLGIIPIVLLFYCYIVTLFSKKSSVLRLRPLVLFFTLLGLVGLYFSFAPTIEIFGREFKTPANYIFSHFPFFRVYARFGLLVILSVSILAGIGLSTILDNIKIKKISLVLSLTISLLVLIEFSNFPPFNYTHTGEQAMPAGYKWLETQPKGVIIEYPFLPTETPHSYYYLLWQRYHQMPLVYGAPMNSEGEGFRKTILDPSSLKTIQKLKDDNVKYIIIHSDLYNPYISHFFPGEDNFGKIPKVDSSLVEFISNYNGDLIYKIK